MGRSAKSVRQESVNTFVSVDTLQVVSPPDLIQSCCLLTLFMSAHLRLGSVQQLQTQGRGETEREGRGKVRGGQEGQGKTIEL